MAAPCSASRRPDRGAGWALPVLGDFLHDWHLNARRGRRDAAADAELCARPPTRRCLGITAAEPEHPLATHLGETQDLPPTSPPPPRTGFLAGSLLISKAAALLAQLTASCSPALLRMKQGLGWVQQVGQPGPWCI